MVNGLKPPKNLVIDFKPSPRQYELWKLLQPDYCPHCGGHIEHTIKGQDSRGNPIYVPQCKECHSQDLPQIILGGGAAGGGKAGLLDSNIVTPFGLRKLRDIKVGDIISSATTGGMQRVIQVHPIGIFPFYRVKFVDGTYFDCSEGHLWQVHQSRKRSKRLDKNGQQIKDRIMETKVMYDWIQRKKQGMYAGCNLIIPLPEPTQFTKSNKLPIDPYVLGALLGDGCFSETQIASNSISFTTMDLEIVERFEQSGINMSAKYAKIDNQALQYQIYDKQLLKYLSNLKLLGHTAKDKFIPTIYKLSTINNRKALMQGLIDTDGYVDDRGHISFSTISENLANDVAFIVRSLGGKATIKRNSAGYTNKETGKFVKCNDVFDVYIMTKCDKDLAYIKRKKDRCKNEFNGGYSELGKRIIDIEYLGRKKGRCITVDEPCGLYLVDDFTVTHNSYLGSAWIISSCMRFPDLRAVIARKTIKSLKESTFNTVRAIMRDWGLVEGENYKVNNLEGKVLFWNDSTILLRELEDAPSDIEFQRLGSSEWTIGFVDEVSEISEKAIEVLFSRLRWKTDETFKYPRLLMTTNPCTTWVRSRFVQDDDGNPVKCRPNEYYLPFSVLDNPSESFRRTYLAALQRITDQATKARLLYGVWDWVESNDIAAYWKFNGEKHLVNGLKEQVYNPLKPLIVSWDFNVTPFMSTLICQIDYDRKKIYVLEEILGKPEDKENNTPKLAQKLAKHFLNEKHSGGLLITGDPAGLARSTQTEEGVNNYTIILNNMNSPQLRPKTKLLRKQPPQVTRLEFVNSLFDGYDGWEILIDMRCRRFTEDLIYQKKNSDGTKSKAKVTDPKLGVKYEKYGHLSDCFDYMLCLFINDSWSKFLHRTSQIETTITPIYGQFSF